MITLRLKNINELKSKTGNISNPKIRNKSRSEGASFKNLLIQCSLCPAWNLKQEEIDSLAENIGAKAKKIGTLCNRPRIDVNPEDYDAIFVLGCGAGVQIVAEELNCSVIPVADTTGIGIKDKDGVKVYCRACGNCIVDLTGGICPITRCAKSLLNGPCGGVHNGLCEINEQPCGWILIINKMKELGRLEELMRPRMPKLKR